MLTFLTVTALTIFELSAENCCYCFHISRCFLLQCILQARVRQRAGSVIDLHTLRQVHEPALTASIFSTEITLTVLMFLTETALTFFDISN